MITIDKFVYRNFADVIDYGNPIGDYRVNCSFCKQNLGKVDYKHKLYISKHKQTVHCFRCGYSASWITFVQDFLQCDRHVAIGELYNKPKVKDIDKIDSFLSKQREEEKTYECSLPKDFKCLYELEGYRQHKRYLIKRGFEETIWKKYNLGVADSYPGRVILPVEQGYFQARAIHNWIKPKYINPKVQSRHYIFNSQALNLYDEVVICEGIFSAIAVGDNAIALLGKQAIYEQIKRLLKSDVSSFIIALEKDAFSTVVKIADLLYNSDRRITLWEYRNGDPADSDDFVVKEYNFKTKLNYLFGV